MSEAKLSIMIANESEVTNILSLGNESQQLLEKISLMEQERLSFVTRIDELSEQNKALWQTVNEMVSKEIG